MTIPSIKGRPSAALLLIGAALLLLGALLGRWVPSNDYAYRNGAAEALTDFAAGRPPKLYWHSYDQIGPGSRTPGLFCPPPGSLDVTRAEIPEAAWSEGHKESFDEMRKSEKARAFAYLYNITMYDLNSSKWKRSCPGLIEEPYRLQRG